MRTWISSGLLVVSLALLGGRTEAQMTCDCAPGVHSSAPVLQGGTWTGPVTAGGITVGQPIVTETSGFQPVVAGTSGTGRILPYSYYVTAPAPARVYEGFGPTDQFPFYGRAYGNPGDRWSWYYMGGGDRRYLAKYYYQLLR